MSSTDAILKSILNLQLVESKDAEPEDLEGTHNLKKYKIYNCYQE